MADLPQKPLFPPGNVITCPVVIDAGIDIHKLLNQHITGCWDDDLDPDQRPANMEALARGEMILSHYCVSCTDGVARTVVLVTTECRSWTMIFLAGDGGFPLAKI